VDKNPLAVDLARVSLWLATAAADHPLTFLDHRLRVGDSLLGMTADDLLRPWAPLPTKSKKATKKSRSIFPLVGRPLALEELYEGAGRQLRERLRRAFASLRTIRELADERPEDLAAHRFAHQAMQAELELFWDLHCLRIGLAFVDSPDPEVINAWLKCLGTLGHLDDATRAQGAAGWQKGRDLSAFCWQLAFPDVWFSDDGEPKEDGGFSVALGNPPWEKVIPDSQEFYSQFDPGVRDYQGRSLRDLVTHINEESPGARRGWDRYAASQKRYAVVLAKGGSYRHQAVSLEGNQTGGHPDLFKFFTERTHGLLHRAGRAGLVLPASLLTNEGCTGLRRLLVERSGVDIICRFDNERRMFPGTDHRFRFVLMAFAGGTGTALFDCFFLNWETPDVLQRLAGDARRVRMSADDLRSLGGELLPILNFQSQDELALALRLQRSLPRLGQRQGLAWSASFTQELNMTTDSHLFCSAAEAAARSADVDGAAVAPPRHDAYRPLYEGRMVNQFDHAAKEYVSGEARKSVWHEIPFPAKRIIPHFFVSAEDCHRLIAQVDTYRGCVCHATGQTNERTLQAAVLPSGCPAGHTVPTLRTDPADASLHLLWIGLANSFVVDWLTRHRASTGIDAFVLEQLPMPRVDKQSYEAREIVTRAARLSCFTGEMAGLWAAVGHDYPDGLDAPWRLDLAATDLRERARLRAEIDAIVTGLYELPVEEFAYILTTFPLLDRSQPTLPGDAFVRRSSKGEQAKPRSYITRDTALLEYCRYKDVAPPEDIVAFYAGISVDISRQTGPIRNLEQRVAEATRLGAIAYVPTPTRRRVDARS